jgi:GntR family transcriptional regulator
LPSLLRALSPRVLWVCDVQLRSWCIGCTNTLVTPFPITIQAGVPISDQIVYAAKRAILSGQMLPGESFPSVRALSKDLRINPNTAHRAITELVDAGLLAMHPGIGTVVAAPPNVSSRERMRLLGRQIQELVVEACRLGVGRDELLRSIEKEYELMNPGYRVQVRR